MRQTLLLSLLSLAVYTDGLSQRAARTPIPIEVHGQVRLSVGGAPADIVLVRLEDFAGGLVEQLRTDRTGKFKFSGLSRAQYTISITAPGYREARQQVDLQTTSSAYVLFQLTLDKPESGPAPRESAYTLDSRIPAAARSEFEKGQASLLDNKIEDGVVHLEKATELYRNFLEAQLLLGTAYMDARRWDRAEASLVRTLEINPRTAAALFALGEVYLQLHRYKEAEQALQDGLKLEGSWQAHFALGRVYWAMGNFAKAGPEVGRTIQLKPDFAQAHLLAGNILLRAQQPDKALPLFEEYLRLEPRGAFSAETHRVVEKIKQSLRETRK